MIRWVLASLAGGVVALSAGCAALPEAQGPRPKTGPKTLLQWSEDRSPRPGSNGNEPDPDKKGNGSGEGTAASDRVEEEPDEIVTDRPDFTEASSTVGKGRVQLEAGYTFTRDRANGERVIGHSYPEALLRLGMFTDWFEFRIGQNFGNERTIMSDGTRTRAGGADDLYLGMKFGLTEQKTWHPEMALILQMTVPTGSSDFSAREVLPGINLLYGWEVVKDKVSVGGSTQANRVRGDFVLPDFTGVGLDVTGPRQEATGKHSYLLLAQSLTVNYTLTKKLGAYTEWFAFFPHSAIGPDVGPEHYLDGGFTYKVTPTFQLDIRAGVGLNRHAADFFAGSGFAVRY